MYIQSVSSKSSTVNGSPTISFQIMGAMGRAKGFLVLIATPNNIPKKKLKTVRFDVDR